MCRHDSSLTLPSEKETQIFLKMLSDFFGEVAIPIVDNDRKRRKT